MKPRELRELITDELALTWLQVPGHTFSPVAFARTQGVSAVDVGRALLRLQDAGHVLLSRSAGVSGVTAVLTPFGQRDWVSGLAASSLAGSRAQMRQAYQFVQAAQPVTAQDVQEHLALPAERVHQLLLMLRSLGSIQAAVDAEGRFTDVRVHPRLLRHLLDDLVEALEGEADQG
ncbi:hypothetical protein E7T09_16735 [Deinococcus sp. KSM4-11]|uniref:hypothetical protein n=1 Tax=Deinococcus sp. KSM4-11 TaxID=2568654 RepID=UPI0010A489B5|nr:hypothetical protein [Deinococcus sp. KSM4-11]THF85594.1 hypothetical protein E7T09_16735 [Deinococcus sp. KSM4-11]